MTLPDLLTIEDLGVKGDGVVRLPDGRCIFVAGALPGETVRASLVKETPEGITARLTEVLRAAPERTAPPCPHFGSCGGCALQHMSAQSYSDFKMRRVQALLDKEGLIPGSVEGPFISPPGSRRRAVLAARCGAEGQVQVGFNERASHLIVEIGSCAVLKPSLAALLPVLRMYLPRVMRTGESYDVALTDFSGAAEILITVLGKTGRPADKNIREVLQEIGTAGGVSRIGWQSGRLNAPEMLYARGEAPAIAFGPFNVVPPPGAFLQATAEGEKALTEFALAHVPRKARIADLYAGCGTFSGALVAAGHSVDAYEGDKAALKALTDAAKGHARLRTFRRDLAREPLTFQELKPYEAVVVDPPRLGAKGQMEELGKSAMATVISISCNLESFVRDGAVLAKKGFRLKRLRVIDQFLWSPHIELAGLFVR